MGKYSQLSRKRTPSEIEKPCPLAELPAKRIIPIREKGKKVKGLN